MTAFYNDHDAFACDWLENLIAAGELTGGSIDRRDIQELQPDDLDGYERVHLMAGIGGWDLAARLAGWVGPLWTASFPCQPFSAAGRRKAFEDERHLWPVGLALIEKCRPATIFGEQVASADGRLWLDRVRTDLEALGYAVGAADLCSAGTGAPNIRQRLFWVADAAGRVERRIRERGARQGRRKLPARGYGSDCSWLEHATSQRRSEGRGRRCSAGSSGVHGGLANSDGQRSDGQQIQLLPRQPRDTSVEAAGRGGFGIWSDFDLIHCTDNTRCRIEPGSFPLAHGLPRSLGPSGTREQRLDLLAAKASRIGRLKGYGNAINPWLAAEFMMASMDARAAS